MNKKKFINVFITALICTVTVLTAGLYTALSPRGKTSTQKDTEAFNTDISQGNLFDSDGNYLFDKTKIIKGNVFTFSGNNWQVVKVSSNVATFWMTKPIYGDKQKFNSIPADGSFESVTTANIYSNAYSGASWKSNTIPSSTVRNYLLTTVVNTLGIGSLNSTQPWKTKVVAPKDAPSGHNSGSSATVTSVIMNEAGHTDLSDDRVLSGDTMVSNYNIDSDILWLPSWEEVGSNGIWGLDDNKYRTWNLSADNIKFAWLRSPMTTDSRLVDVVGYAANLVTGGGTKAIYAAQIATDAVGVRPALHLNISTAPTASYTISFNANGGSGDMAPASQTAGNYTLPNNAFGRNGWNFIGWRDNSEGIGTLYSAGATYTLSANITFYAQWEQVKYTVSFNANGGTGTMNPVQAVGSYTLPANGFTQAGYTFTGWKAGNSGNLLTVGSQVNISGPVTYYAQWELTKYTVSFDANGGSGGMQDVSQVGAYILPANGFTPPTAEDEFVGWKANNTGETRSVGYSYMVSANVKFYAQWRTKTYTITFYANGGNGSMSPVVQAKGSYVLPANSFTRTSYTFTGWKAGNTGSTLAVGSTYNITQSVEFYAQWELTKYTVSFNVNGGTGTMSPVQAVGSYTLPANGFTPAPSYTFAGWKAGNTGSMLAVGSTYNVTQAVEFYAQWTDVIWTITWTMDNDAVLATTNVPEGATPTYPNTNPTKPTTPSYVYGFSGWTPAIIPAVANATYKAVFTATPILTITWNNYDGSLIKTTTIVSGHQPQYNGDTPVRPSDATYNYTFSGWSPALSTVTVNTTYTAQFASVLITYAVTFNANGGTGTMDAVQTVGSYILPAAAFTRTGYDFAGWKAGNADPLIAAGGTYTVSSDVAFYAQWTGKTATATLSLTNKVYDGQSIGTPNVIFKVGGTTVTIPDAVSVYSYSGRNSTVYPASTAAPVNVGEYTVTAVITSPNYIGGITVTDGLFAITIANQIGLKAVVNKESSGTTSWPVNTAGSISAPEYDGICLDSSNVTVSYQIASSRNFVSDIISSKTYSEIFATKGTYYIRVLTTATSNVSAYEQDALTAVCFEVTDVEELPKVSAPVAKAAELLYVAGTAQKLLKSAGVTDKGKMQYFVSVKSNVLEGVTAGADWTDNINDVTATEIGDYYIFYRIIDATTGKPLDKNFDPIHVEIKAEVTPEKEPPMSLTGRILQIIFLCVCIVGTVSIIIVTWVCVKRAKSQTK